MNPATLFIAGIIAVLIPILLSVKDWQAFKDHPKLKNVSGGIGMVVGLAAIVASIMWSNRSEAGELEYLKYAGMFVGVDYDNQSLFCRNAAPDIVKDDKWTSNVGFKLNALYMRESNLLFTGDITYQHHSCAINQDKPTYDAAGVKFELLYFFN